MGERARSVNDLTRRCLCLTRPATENKRHEISLTGIRAQVVVGGARDQTRPTTSCSSDVISNNKSHTVVGDDDGDEDDGQPLPGGRGQSTNQDNNPPADTQRSEKKIFQHFLCRKN